MPRGSPAAQAALGSAFRASVSRQPSLGEHLSLASLSCSSSRVRHEHCTQRSLRGVKQESGGAWVELKTPGCPTDPRSPHATSRSLWDLIQVCTQHTRPREHELPSSPARDGSLDQAHAWMKGQLHLAGIWLTEPSCPRGQGPPRGINRKPCSPLPRVPFLPSCSLAHTLRPAPLKPSQMPVRPSARGSVRLLLSLPRPEAWHRGLSGGCQQGWEALAAPTTPPA